jgi:hypothetical protein
VNIRASRVLWKDARGYSSTNGLRICFRILLKGSTTYSTRRYVTDMPLIMSTPSVLFLCGRQIFLAGQVLNVYLWTNCSIKSIRSPIKFPAASSTKIGPNVAKLTTTEDGAVSGCVEGMYC